MATNRKCAAKGIVPIVPAPKGSVVMAIDPRRELAARVIDQPRDLAKVAIGQRCVAKAIVHKPAIAKVAIAPGPMRIGHVKGNAHAPTQTACATANDHRFHRS